ncbi:hypothetical protein [Desulfosporosinus metallidurans]|uniref:hypothetical protein n=1 Tax=Desulfosporosinus metallidurans TaxID=1888891 RepID=UPI00094D7AAE|nr:hypothetical protein [Desulfosporosinus metallidurans]
MARTKQYFRPKKLSLVQQDVAIKSLFPSFQGNIDKVVATWEGVIQPTPACKSYKIKITYSFNSTPKVWVVSPPIEDNAGGTRPPHIYRDRNLCLWQPRTGEWTAEKYIARTIIPWTSVWLYHYEIWQTTGEWLGGGIHPILRSEED